MNWLIIFNKVISLLFTLCFAYQVFFALIGFFAKPKKMLLQKENRFAFVISARNEMKVICELIKSIKEQDYPSHLVDIYVIADNCTDSTKEVAEAAGAFVYERKDEILVGKGYALDWFFQKIKDKLTNAEYDGYFVVDADNVLAPDFISQMNRVFSNGYKVVTSYRNSKNYGQNWITAGYSLWFLREARYLNNSRMFVGTSCAISGTGFLVSNDVLVNNGGWTQHLLTEDLEFTARCVIEGEKIGYCANAVIYDEQPTKFHQSYIQRMRWAKGFYQVFMKYGVNLFKGIFKGSFSCYDVLMTLMPAMFLSLISVVVNVVAIPVGFMNNTSEMKMVLEFLCKNIASFYGIFFAMGALATISEWKRIYTSILKKIFYVFTFPIFMMTYVPISIVALFKKVEWQPIKHCVSKSVDDICKREVANK